MKTAKLNIKFPENRSIDVEATFTDAACIVVHPTVHWELNESEPKMVDKDWTISQYPTGYKIFDGIPSKEGAILCANKFLASKLFVSLDTAEIENEYRVSNLTKEEVEEGIKALCGARDYINEMK